MKTFTILVLILSNVLTYTMFSITHEPVQAKKECPKNENISLVTFDGEFDVRKVYRLGEFDYMLGNLEQSFDNSFGMETDVIKVEFKKIQK